MIKTDLEKATAEDKSAPKPEEFESPEALEAKASLGHYAADRFFPEASVEGAVQLKPEQRL